jgi:hypothetical protein
MDKSKPSKRAVAFEQARAAERSNLNLRDQRDEPEGVALAQLKVSQQNKVKILDAITSVVGLAGKLLVLGGA